MLVLFDACWRPDSGEPGEDLYIPGVHNSASVQCPTHTVLRAFGQGEAWAKNRLHQYVTAVVRRFATDPRVAIWDIYNEPTMRQSEHLILPRLAAINGWAAGRYPEHWLLDGPKLNTILPLVRQAGFSELLAGRFPGVFGLDRRPLNGPEKLTRCSRSPRQCGISRTAKTTTM